MTLVLLTLPYLALGLLVGRLVALVVPPVVCAALFAGLAAGWWGAGLGDGWPYALGALILAGVAASAVGVALRHAAARARKRPGRPLHGS